jgi:HEAT repeat protein
MLARSAIPKLRQALSDTEPSVVFAAAHALVLLKDNQGYDVYYEVLTGERKPGKGFIAGQLDTFKDPKKLAAFSLQQGIGFVPFGGYGYTAVKMLLKDDTSPVRASAARVLADDPDPKSQDALARVAVEDKHEIVRIAALEAIAHHGNPALIAKIAPAMSDSKDAVSYTAAAAVLHLTDIAETKRPHKKTSRGRAD